MVQHNNRSRYAKYRTSEHQPIYLYESASSNVSLSARMPNDQCTNAKVVLITRWSSSDYFVRIFEGSDISKVASLIESRWTVRWMDAVKRANEWKLVDGNVDMLSRSRGQIQISVLTGNKSGNVNSSGNR